MVKKNTISITKAGVRSLVELRGSVYVVSDVVVFLATFRKLQVQPVPKVFVLVFGFWCFDDFREVSIHKMLHEYC